MFAFTRGKTVQKWYGNGTESNGRYGMRYDSCVRLERSIIESLYDRSTKMERQLFFVHYCTITCAAVPRVWQFSAFHFVLALILCGGHYLEYHMYHVHIWL